MFILNLCCFLQQPPLFTIVRRPGELESQEHLNTVPSSQRHSNSAPLQVQDYNEELTENEKKENQRYTSDNSLVARSHDGRYSQMTSIDDNRLRRLLEELYKDKKYFDNYIESKGKAEFVSCSRYRTLQRRMKYKNVKVVKYFSAIINYLHFSANNRVLLSSDCAWLSNIR